MKDLVYVYKEDGSVDSEATIKATEARDKRQADEAEILSRLTTVKEHDKSQRKHQAYLMVALFLIVLMGAFVYVAYILAQDAENSLPAPSATTLAVVEPLSTSETLEPIL